MARKRIVCIKRSPKRQDPYRHMHVGSGGGSPPFQGASGGGSEAPWSNHRQGGGEHEAQFLVGVAQRIFDELGRVLAAEDKT